MMCICILLHFMLLNLMSNRGVTQSYYICHTFHNRTKSLPCQKPCEAVLWAKCHCHLADMLGITMLTCWCTAALVLSGSMDIRDLDTTVKSEFHWFWQRVYIFRFHRVMTLGRSGVTFVAHCVTWWDKKEINITAKMSMLLHLFIS